MAVDNTIDIVGHFGTTYSYATVASNVALALLRDGCLGQILNLDPQWGEYPALQEHAQKSLSRPRGDAVFVVTAPAPYVDMFPAMYGNAALFVSPNTNTIDQAHAKVCSQFDLLIAPSEWSLRSTMDGLNRVAATSSDRVKSFAVCGLGVDDDLLKSREARVAMKKQKATSFNSTLLHVSSDQSWPGRKGTEELLFAMAELKHRQMARRIRLRAHIPPALLRSAAMLVRDLEIDDMVDIIISSAKGSEPGWFERELSEADMVVAPSRCEGYGIMLASALAAGVPLLATAVTGQLDFLSRFPGWAALPTGQLAILPGEEAGEAPTVEPGTLASHLEILTNREVRMQLAIQLGREDVAWDKLTWSTASQGFAEVLQQWQW